jgi:plastocyanin
MVTVLSKSLHLAAIALLLTLAPVTARAQSYTITLKDHRFQPAELTVPSGKRITVTVVNEDPTPEEFESRELKFEKVIPGKSKGVVRFGPLAKGRYTFFGEYHEDTAKGVVVAE